ncbi:MAG TPA: hypothetical protein VFW44_10160 [Bryobacteraceae bacterium]|nr:hypothetical protein [Bryobacteraceae bacterium]
MHQLPIEQQFLLAIQLAFLVSLCIKLWYNGLYKLYVFFFFYLVLELAQGFLPIFVPVNRPFYRIGYVASQGLVICSYALVVLELYAVVLKDLRGLAGIARRYIQITLAVAIGLSLLPLRIERVPTTLTGYLFIFERPVLSSLVFFILLISAFLVYYPIPLGRNVIVYLIGYAVFFLAASVVALFQNLGYFWNRVLSSVNMGVFVLCIAFWLISLSRQGERKRVVIGHQWNPSDDERLMGQLRAINASLLRSRKNKSTTASKISLL